MRRSERQGALTLLPPASCHGIVGSDGTRRCMTRDARHRHRHRFLSPRRTSPPFTAHGYRRRSNLRHGLILRASAASLAASTSSIVRQRFENLNTLTGAPGELSIRPRWSAASRWRHHFARDVVIQ